MTAVVLDTSAILAFLLEELGGRDVALMLEGRALVSAVNMQELLVKLIVKGMSPHHARLTVRSLNLECHAHSIDAAEAAAELFQHTKGKGLSLGDRSCLALASKMTMPAVTADQVWSEIADAIGVEVVLIR
ncbi:hypothetical protein GCM10011390_21980 [Aureimonas endophytica]|uniref:PIN domain-containing protein n=1 Tax=Aureimonas endophytica TaxID=2027858 RepID=A0A916ZLX6_9HYPH|nr:type II toxin-antitoxin system VapC family toxin [Aureimonas endophytica]GGE02728.1 hypothetical protein GCM10011390_21980 [Aureimonas endophytica]